MTIFLKVRKQLGLNKYKMANLLEIGLGRYTRMETINKKVCYKDVKRLFKVSGWTAEKFVKEL